jgi:hypothetical protein
MILLNTLITIGKWFLEPVDKPTGQYVTNITTGIQYEWDGEAWIKSYQGVYVGGTWSLVL